MTRHERLLENYEDAYFALLMEDVAQMENARLDRFNTELQNDPHAAVPEELTKRCLKTINAHFSNMRRSSSLRIVKKAINLAAILITISTLLFTSAFAISDEFRTATLNLVITANEKYTQLKMKQEDPPQESGNSMVTDNNEFFKNICLAWLPDGYEYLSGEYDGDFFEQLSDPNNLYWNYFHQTGEIQIGWAVDGGLDMDTVCEREKLSIEEFYAKYGTPVVTTNLYDADGFIGLLSEINSFIQNGNLKSELQYLMDQTEQAKETHRMEVVNDIYKKLHDLDYFLLRYGPKDVAKYVEDDSTVSKYYGTLPFY